MFRDFIIAAVILSILRKIIKKRMQDLATATAQHTLFHPALLCIRAMTGPLPIPHSEQSQPSYFFHVVLDSNSLILQ